MGVPAAPIEMALPVLTVASAEFWAMGNRVQ